MLRCDGVGIPAVRGSIKTKAKLESLARIAVKTSTLSVVKMQFFGLAQMVETATLYLRTTLSLFVAELLLS